MPARITDTSAWYVQAGYQFVDWFQLSSYYLDVLSEDEGRATDHGDWHKEFSVTARFDITRNFLLKLEGHVIDGTAIVQGLENPNGTEQNWNMFLARFTFFF
jgi:hypothetical protein